MIINRYIMFLLAALLSLGFLVAVSLGFGVRAVGWAEVLAALTAYDTTQASHIVVQDLRLPRALAALVGGGALGLAGALMQALSRNPLADPGLLGINGGAALGVVVAIWVLGISAQGALVLPAMVGALVATLLVMTLGRAGRRNGPEPTRLVLAGAAVGALFLALTWAVLILSRESLETYRFWVLGGFTDISLPDLLALMPVYALAAPLGLVSAFLLAPLALGDDAARALGVRVGLARGLSLIAVVLLCGATVSMAGPIAFVGLVVPHLARAVVGPDVRVLAPASALLGGAMALVADVLGRVVMPGQEIEAGAMMALIGGPALILLVRSRWTAAWAAN